MSDLQRQVVDLVRTLGHERRDEPFKLASGQTSHDYIDGKRAVDTGPRLTLVANAILELTRHHGILFDAVGGRTMGADPIAHAVCMMSSCAWFSVRKEPKPRGHARWIEGSALESGRQVLLVDDIVTTGGSIRVAYEHVVETGASVSGVVPMVDRGDQARPWFEKLSIPYVPLMTYHDLKIESIDGPTFANTSG